MASDASEATSSSGSVTTPGPDDASGHGLTLTLIGVVLLALAYYGVVAIQGDHRL